MTAERTLTEGQEVMFQPSALSRGALAVLATVTKVWGPGCVNVRVEYPDGAREETSVLVCFPDQLRPNGGYYVYPKE